MKGQNGTKHQLNPCLAFSSCFPSLGMQMHFWSFYVPGAKDYFIWSSRFVPLQLEELTVKFHTELFATALMIS